MGVVYEAWDPLLERTVALKTIDVAAGTASVEELAGYELRFFAEARIAARLSHPGIVVVHDVGQDPRTGTLYISLEYLQGRTLAEILAAGGPLPWAEALRIVGRVAEALNYAHLQGVTHRDIKPANVMLLASGEPKIMDFGIAKTETARIQLTIAGQSLGTPLYTSPEQALGQPTDRRSDLFCLGAIAYSLLTGRVAFGAANLTGVLTQVIEHDPPAPSSIVPGLPPGVDQVIRRVLAKNPDDRYPDGTALAEDISDVLGSRPPRHDSDWHGSAARGSLETDLDRQFAALIAPADDLPATLPRPTQRWLRRRPAAFGALAVLILVLAAVPLWRARHAIPGSPTLAATPVPERANAWLAIDLERPSGNGSVRVWVDRAIVAEQGWSDRAQDGSQVVPFGRDGARSRMALAPGGHDVEVQVYRDGKSSSERIWGDFRPGATHRLRARFSGLLRKRLSLEWE